MTELLEDLKKLDPKTYDLINYTSKTLHGVDVQENPNARTIGHIIQGEIQLAIADRQWGLVLQSEMWLDRNQFSADIADIDGNNISGSEGDSYAEATMKAYLAALGAQP